MKVVMVAVSSLNGKITKGDDSNIYSWTSKEDTKLFFSTIEKHDLIIMGGKTYEAARSIIKLKPNKLRIVLTKTINKYRDHVVQGSLEFSNESPKALIKRLKMQGYLEMLVVGGGDINALFLKDKLVNEVHLTIEPFLFGKGKNLVSEGDFTASLRLLGINKLNSRGTLQLRYLVTGMA